ncbi:CLIP domain-containing serine protease B9-like [Achroia grisella]|uniref:CLIP domain-containing serine protease B9-like n=1 Tax=Achroia grisella TaxID=688607 RepID=UPI0027D31E22|nr:CLIP domain-containing serine protease B9-like [Achroia grisella]
MKCFIVLCVCALVEGVRLSYIHRNDKKCGVEASTNLIHRNPWLVFVEFQRKDSIIDIRCAGTLVGKRHIITAAHCVKKHRYNKLIARLGEYDTSKRKDCLLGVCADPVVRIEVETVIIHDGYNGNGYGNDIAILVLKTAAPYTDFIRPACLPNGPVDETVLLFAAGWGELTTSSHYSDVKKIIPLPLWSPAECRAVYPHTNLPEDIICAGGEKNMDTCRGDSGGPLIWIRERAELRGVTSTGYIHCGTENAPGLYTSVEYHLPWIEATIYGY